MPIVLTPESPGAGMSGQSIRQQIVDALETRMQSILTTGGYNTDIGTNVFIHRATPMQESEIPGMNITEQERVTQDTVGEELHEMSVSLLVVEDGEASVSTLRDIEADLVYALGQDRTFGGLAQDTGTVSVSAAEVRVGDRVVAGAQATFTIEYTTENMNPYQ